MDFDTSGRLVPTLADNGRRYALWTVALASNGFGVLSQCTVPVHNFAGAGPIIAFGDTAGVSPDAGIRRRAARQAHQRWSATIAAEESPTSLAWTAGWV